MYDGVWGMGHRVRADGTWRAGTWRAWNMESDIHGITRWHVSSSKVSDTG